jgi:hypothetical protein
MVVLDEPELSLTICAAVHKLVHKLLVTLPSSNDLLLWAKHLFV